MFFMVVYGRFTFLNNCSNDPLLLQFALPLLCVSEGFDGNGMLPIHARDNYQKIHLFNLKWIDLYR